MFERSFGRGPFVIVGAQGVPYLSAAGAGDEEIVDVEELVDATLQTFASVAAFRHAGKGRGSCLNQA